MRGAGVVAVAEESRDEREDGAEGNRDEREDGPRGFIARRSFLDEGCKRLHAVNRNESYEFCVTSLQVDPDSRTANLSQLTLIASKLTKKNYTHTFGVIQQLLGNQSLSHSQREALGACNETYSSEIEHADIAIVDLETGDPEDAVGLLQAAARAPGNCESAFSDRHEASLIPGEDALASLISALARDLAVLLNYKG
uniref:Pectinesterase inhibitor domain-containing protein n=1 Tax=Ananas comosus var. bracteatus TaxID=296719 RepID=A0A6V7P4A4_ANACO|nr:unnamed protein product [Ananas comosus var. bracteatus]